mmetsp:Transcript_25450/g.51137  ORF Transcript_25450/g.51137 Transcript_25450/m.51137 type:complete len:157 (-) Transcript_25450:299-769(-)|eukprot:CAMPEP_0174731210 /NCGR_PEP_ID=MMETSP1094-20130205/57095_1 /TAXON_ID=156173 /ORGANISM="Chrysochromulina brevifilum, Strain UTEX LB 985" /LENGTH=156 /DNA_ID=CAMNT_0015933563 /DNA_START=10 /DNA_END=480 /DNA_ORIENTATION=-
MTFVLRFLLLLSATTEALRLPGSTKFKSATASPFGCIPVPEAIEDKMPIRPGFESVLGYRSVAIGQSPPPPPRFPGFGGDRPDGPEPLDLLYVVALGAGARSAMLIYEWMRRVQPILSSVRVRVGMVDATPGARSSVRMRVGLIDAKPGARALIRR